MKKMIIAISALLSVTLAVAQDDGLSRRIEVTRDYVPAAERAEKIDVTPRMADTVKLHPQVDYSITPTAWMSVYAPEPIAAVGVSVVKWEESSSLFAELGMGGPLQSLANIYYSPHTQKNISIGAYLNHEGQFAKIENDMSHKLSARTADSRLGAFVQNRFERGGNMQFDMEYRTRDLAPYGGYSLMNTDFSSGPRLLYDDVVGNFTIGSDFTDLSRLNARIRVQGIYFNQHTKGLDEKYIQWEMNTFIDAGVNVAGRPLMLGFIWLHAADGGVMKGQSGSSYKFSAVYSLSRDERFTFDVGARYATNRNALFPIFKLGYNIGGVVKPYIDIDGGVEDNSMRVLAYENPYMSNGLLIDKFNAHLNMKGGLNITTSTVDMDLNVGYDINDKYNQFVNIDRSPRFTIYGTAVNILYFSAKANVRVSRRLSADVSGRYNSVTVKDAEDYNLQQLYDGTGVPEYRAEANVRYRNGKLSLKAGAELLGKRTFASVADNSYVGSIVHHDGLVYYGKIVDPTLDLNVEGRYSIRDSIVVFLRGRNLLGERLYEYNYYPCLGANVMAGVIINF